MKEQLAKIRSEALAAFGQAQSAAELDSLRVQYLGKKGELTAVLKMMGKLSAEELDDAVAEGCTELWSLAERFGVTEEFMRRAVCWYTYGNLAVEEYMSF